MFGPSVTISEVFAYLGGAFLLAAWSSFMARTESGGEAGVVLGAMALLAAGVLGVMGLASCGGSERMSRAVGCRVPPGRQLRGGGRRRLRERGRTRLAG